VYEFNKIPSAVYTVDEKWTTNYWARVEQLSSFQTLVAGTEQSDKEHKHSISSSRQTRRKQ
jgi:head-tail adaptor